MTWMTPFDCSTSAMVTVAPLPFSSQTVTTPLSAFSKLPAGTVDTLLKPENKAMLTKVLTYHVVAGRWSNDDLKKAIKQGKGTATLKTVSGGMLWAMMQGGTLTARMAGNGVSITDAKGNSARVTTADVYQSNGVIHVVDTVLMP